MYSKLSTRTKKGVKQIFKNYGQTCPSKSVHLLLCHLRLTWYITVINWIITNISSTSLVPTITRTKHFTYECNGKQKNLWHTKIIYRGLIRNNKIFSKQKKYDGTRYRKDKTLWQLSVHCMHQIPMGRHYPLWPFAIFIWLFFSYVTFNHISFELMLSLSFFTLSYVSSQLISVSWYPSSVWTYIFYSFGI